MKECGMCKTINKPRWKRVFYPSLLQLLPICEGIWRIITMDFMEWWSRLGGKNVIKGIVDRFLKFVYFLAIKHLFIAQEIAHLFLEHVYKFEGLPYSIMIDRDKVFISLL